MSTYIRTLAAVAMAWAVVPAVQAAIVTDSLGQEAFRGCYYLTCLPGVTGPVGLVSSSAAQLKFSDQATFAFSVAGGEVDALAPAWKTRDRLYDPDTEEIYSSNVAVNGLSIASVRRDDATLGIQGMSIDGGFSFVASLAPPSFVRGGSLKFTDLKVDVSTMRVTADIEGHRNAYFSSAGEDFTLNDVAVWSFTQLVGPSSFDPQALMMSDGASLAVYSAQGLTLTSEGLAAFTRGLGLQKTAKEVVSSVTDWGSLTLDLHYGHVPGEITSSVPEPAAWALMGAGLAVLVLARRARLAARA